MTSWAINGTGAQAFTAATPADLLREMATFVDEWTENDTSGTRFVADVSVRFGGESVTPWEGIVYTDNTEHLDLLFARKVDSGVELGFDEFEDAYEAAGSVVNIGAVNVFLGEA